MHVPLTLWSQLGDWLADPAIGPAFQDLIDQRGGIKGRMGDLLSDPVSRNSALIVPLISVTEFPGFPLTSEDAEQLLTGP